MADVRIVVSQKLSGEWNWAIYADNRRVTGGKPKAGKSISVDDAYDLAKLIPGCRVEVRG